MPSKNSLIKPIEDFPSKVTFGVSEEQKNRQASLEQKLKEKGFQFDMETQLRKKHSDVLNSVEKELNKIEEG